MHYEVYFDIIFFLFVTKLIANNKNNEIYFSIFSALTLLVVLKKSIRPVKN